MSVVRRRYYKIFYKTRPWWGRTVRVSITDLEECALQTRLIIEGVVLAAAHANIGYYGKILEFIHNELNLSKIIKTLNKNNMNSVPISMDFISKREDFRFSSNDNKTLSEDYLTSLHGKTGNLLHRRHMLYDFGESNEIVNEIIEFIPKLRKWLARHIVYISTDNGLILVDCQMFFHQKKPVSCAKITFVRPENNSSIE